MTLTPANAEALEGLRRNDSGKFRLVNFWATWCAPCVAEFPEFVTMNRMDRHRDFEMVLVSLNRPDESARVLGFLRAREASNRNLILASEEREPARLDGPRLAVLDRNHTPGLRGTSAGWWARSRPSSGAAGC